MSQPQPLGLRPHQTLAIEMLRERMRMGERRIILELVTAGGKTAIAIAMIRAAVAKGGRCMFVVNRVQLLQQTVERFAAQGIDVGVIQGANTRGTHRRVIVASIATINSRPAEVPADLSLLVIDEAHAAGGDSRLHALIERVAPGGSKTAVVGLSATPWASGMARHREALKGPLFQSKVCPVTAAELIAQGYLCDATIYAPSEPDMEGVKTVAGDWQEEGAAERANAPKLIGDIVTTYLKHGQGKKAVAFACNIAHSQAIEQAFQKVGIDARHIDYRMPTEARAELLAEFDAGKFQILCNPLLLREGWDCPSVEVLIMARPTKSLISWVQIAGRILRTHDNISVLYRSYMEDRDACRGDEMDAGRQAGEHGGRGHGFAIRGGEASGIPSLEREEPGLLLAERARLPAVQRQGEGAQGAWELHDGFNSQQVLQRSQAGGYRIYTESGQPASGQPQGRGQAEQRGRKPGVGDEPGKHDSCSPAWLVPGKSARRLARDEQASGVAGSGDQAGAEIVSSWSIDGTGKKIRCTQDDDKRDQGWQDLGACFVAGDASEANHLARVLCRMHQGEESLLVVEASADTGAARRIAGVEIKTHGIILDHSGTALRLGFPTDDRSDMPLDDGRPKSGSERKEKEEKAPPLPKACPECAFVKPAGVHECPACGHVPRRPSDVETAEGELRLVAKSERHKATDPALRFGTKQTLWSMLLGYCDAKGYKRGYASNKYKQITGVWPRGVHDVVRQPSQELLSWLRAEQIRWSHARQKLELVA